MPFKKAPKTTQRKTYSKRKPTTRTVRKKTYKRRQPFGMTKPTINTRGLPFGNHAIFKLPYSESFAISASGTSGLTAVGYTYRLNGPYDPRFNLGGGQPIQWDLIAPAYKQYQVISARFTVTFSNPLYDGMFIGFRVKQYGNTITTAGRTIEEVKEMENTRSRWVNNTGSQVVTFTETVRPHHLLGINWYQYQDLGSYGSLINNTPGGEVTLEPFALHTVSGEDSVIRCTVRIDYIIHFYGKQTVLDV